MLLFILMIIACAFMVFRGLAYCSKPKTKNFIYLILSLFLFVVSIISGILMEEKVSMSSPLLCSEEFYEIKGYENFIKSKKTNTFNIQTYDAWNPTVTYRDSEGLMFILNVDDYKTAPTFEFSEGYHLVKETRGYETSWKQLGRSINYWVLYVPVER